MGYLSSAALWLIYGAVKSYHAESPDAGVFYFVLSTLYVIAYEIRSIRGA